MAKPDADGIRWAEDPSALKATTTSSQWEDGWVAPGGVEDPPILNYQNYWQNSVQLWVEWFDSVIPDSVGTSALVDLWEWTTGHQDFDRLPRTPNATAVRLSGNDLELRITVPAALAADWDQQINDTWVGARHYELLDILQRGLGLQVIDGSGVTWVIYASTQLSGTVSAYIKPTATSANPQDGLANRISGTNGNFTVLRDGVAQSSPFFTGFTAIIDNADTQAFSTANPNGWRVVLPGTPALSSLFLNEGRDIVRGAMPRRRWLRPLDVARVAAVTQTTQSCKWPLLGVAADASTPLRVTYNFTLQGGVIGPQVKMYSRQDFAAGSLIDDVGVSGTLVESSLAGSAFPTTSGSGFTGLGLEFPANRRPKRAVGDVDLVGLYNDNPRSWVYIEELY